MTNPAPNVKRLKFYPDDSADPVWEAETGSHVDVDWLPLDPDTRAALRTWAQAWAALLDRLIWAHAIDADMADGTPDPVSREEWDRAECQARKLFERMKGELGPDWSVEWDLTLPD